MSALMFSRFQENILKQIKTALKYSKLGAPKDLSSQVCSEVRVDF